MAAPNIEDCACLVSINTTIMSICSSEIMKNIRKETRPITSLNSEAELNHTKNICKPERVKKERKRINRITKPI